MTALDTTTTASPPTVADPAARASETPTGARSGSPWRRVTDISALALIVIFLAWGLFALFEGPVADSWYTRRQQQLVSNYQAAGSDRGPGAAIALLQIPSLGTNLVIAEGDSPEQLRSGPGHRIGTPLPGDVGNSVIVGHRSAWHGPLENVSALKVGEHIVVQTIDADGLPRNAVFTITATSKVAGNDRTLFTPSDDHRLTLATGTGGTYSDQLLVVTAVSGSEGKVLPATRATRATTGAGSTIFNSTALLAFVGLAGAVALWVLLRKRYHVAAVIAVVLPVAAVGLCALLLNIDAGLPPLR